MRRIVYAEEGGGPVKRKEGVKERFKVSSKKKEPVDPK